MGFVSAPDARSISKRPLFVSISPSIQSGGVPRSSLFVFDFLLSVVRPAVANRRMCSVLELIDPLFLFHSNRDPKNNLTRGCLRGWLVGRLGQDRQSRIRIQKYGLITILFVELYLYDCLFFFESWCEFACPHDPNSRSANRRRHSHSQIHSLSYVLSVALWAI
jgi:hypothetical protein